MKQQRLFTILLISIGIFVFAGLGGWGTPAAIWAQDNPTPPVINLTPTITPTPNLTLTPGATPPPATPTTGNGLGPDRFEPNDDVGSATIIGLVFEPDLTLVGEDEDYFTGYVKAGQLIRVSTYVDGVVDTEIIVFWNGQEIGRNDDRSPSDLGSTVVFSTDTDGWYVAQIRKAGVLDGSYDLEAALAEPTPTLTPLPTSTPEPTSTPVPTTTPIIQPDMAEPNNSPGQARAIVPGVRGAYTVGAGDVDYFTFIAKLGTNYTCETITSQVDTLLEVSGVSGSIGVNDDRAIGRVDSMVSWYASQEQPVTVRVEARGGTFGPYELICQAAAPAPPPMPAPASPTPFGMGGSPITDTIGITDTVDANHIPLVMRPMGRVLPEEETDLTSVSILIYYDANNDRQPGPGEGIANVSVVAVDAQGQRVARVFTNSQGEATFNVVGEVDRLVVPFVASWSARIRQGQPNDNIILGLPAVKLPVFVPVRPPELEQ